jgi:hypothetical protein
MIFYNGVASTPHTIGLKNLTTNEVISQICVSKPTGKETRKRAYNIVRILKAKYSHLIN